MAQGDVLSLGSFLTYLEKLHTAVQDCVKGSEAGAGRSGTGILRLGRRKPWTQPFHLSKAPPL